MAARGFGENLAEIDMGRFKDALTYVLTHDASEREVEGALAEMDTRMPGLKDALGAFEECADEMSAEILVTPEQLSFTHAGAMMVFLAFSRMARADDLDAIPTLPVE